MQLSMTRDEREAFLAGVHVGVVVVARPGGAAPLASPVWYAYEPGGEVTFVTGAATEKAALLRTGPAVTFLVQQEAPPQRYAAVEGDASAEVATDDRERLAIARRYLPAEAVEPFVAMTPREAVVLVRLRPSVWRTTDFSKLPAP